MDDQHKRRGQRVRFQPPILVGEQGKWYRPNKPLDTETDCDDKHA